MTVKFSIIIPLYNKAAYLERSLEALYQQKHKPYEIIIIDDVSTDKSYRIARQFLLAKRIQYPDIKIVLYQNFHNSGPGASRNKGIELASGSHLFFLDADDEYQPLLLKKVFKLVIQYRTDMVIFGFKRMPENRLRPVLDEIPEWLEKKSEDHFLLKQPLEIVMDRNIPLGPGSNAMVSKQALGNIRYDETSYVFEGIDFWFRVLQHLHRQNRSCYLLKGPYHQVNTITNSLIRKPLQLQQIQTPYLLTRYSGSRDYYECQLRCRISRVWFEHDLSRLGSYFHKLLFIWKYRHIAWLVQKHKWVKFKTSFKEVFRTYLIANKKTHR